VKEKVLKYLQDLVKAHLMNAVRKEVNDLKERIIILEEVIAKLKIENEFFRLENLLKIDKFCFFIRLIEMSILGQM